MKRGRHRDRRDLRKGTSAERLRSPTRRRAPEDPCRAPECHNNVAPGDDYCVEHQELNP